MPTRTITLQLTVENDELEPVSELVSAVRSLKNVQSAEILEIRTKTENIGQGLEQLLNQFSAENESNTPDYILASLLRKTLQTWDNHTKERDRWWGNRSLLGPGNDHPAVTTDDKTLL